MTSRTSAIARRLGRRAILLSTVLFLVAGCASSGGGSGSEAGGPEEDQGDGVGTIRVVVENRINPPQSLTVTLTSDMGRRLLGSVGPAQTRTINYEHGALGGESYRLIAQTQAGIEITSTPFRLSAGVEVLWRLPANGVTVGPQ